MIYNLQNPIECESARRMIYRLIENGETVEITKKSKRRTLSQNRYLHLILAYFGTQTGNKADFVKQVYFKRAVNAQYFLQKSKDQLVGDIETLRSTKELTTEQLSVCIDRFRNWASQEAGIYIPEANEYEKIAQVEKEIHSCRAYL